MKNILVVNCGSSSIKYDFFRGDNLLCNGLVEKIGEKGSSIQHWLGAKKVKKIKEVKDHEAGLKEVFSLLTSSAFGVIKDLAGLDAVSHRIVHGGENAVTEVIDSKVLAKIKKYCPLAPLHNPVNLLGVKTVMKLAPGVKNIAVYDNGFYRNMPEKAFLYPLPLRYYRNYGIRRYGFHGTSHKYVAQRAARLLGKPFNSVNIISCHLGAGSSITAVEKGRAVETSMGLTPLEGLMMATRTGDIDPSMMYFLEKLAGMGLEESYSMLNKECGLLGVSGKSKDVRVIKEGKDKGDKRCGLALEMYAYRLKKYVGAYMAVLGKVDAIVFTAGIGENAGFLRALVCRDMEELGIRLDKKKNSVMSGSERVISASNSKIKVMVIPTNESLMIVKESKALV